MISSALARLALGALFISVPAFSQDVKCTLPDKGVAFPNDVGIEYKLCHDLPAKVLPANRETFSTKVQLKNTNAAAVNVMLCVYGQTLTLKAQVDTQDIKVQFDGTKKQFLCKFAEKPMTPVRYGNIGCQMAAIPAGQTVDLIYTTGNQPASPDSTSKVVQDGNYRVANGPPAGQAGKGHKVAASAGVYLDPNKPNKTLGVKALQDVIDKFVLNLFVLKGNGVEMGCMKKADAAVSTKPEDKDAPYVPPCAAPVAVDAACNKCFGMDSRLIPPVLAKNDPNAQVVTAETTFLNKQPPKKAGGVGGLMDLPIRLQAGAIAGNSTNCNVQATVRYVPDPSTDPNLLTACNPASPGCFGITQPQIQPFPVSPLDLTEIVLTINFPSTTPDSFAADFFVDMSAAGDGCGVTSGSILQETDIRYRPQLMCDVTQDGQVDLLDINLISSVIGATADPGSPFDPDGDGMVTVLDARACVLKCTKPGCAQ